MKNIRRSEYIARRRELRALAVVVAVVAAACIACGVAVLGSLQDDYRTPESQWKDAG